MTRRSQGFAEERRIANITGGNLGAKSYQLPKKFAIMQTNKQKNYQFFSAFRILMKSRWKRFKTCSRKCMAFVGN